MPEFEKEIILTVNVLGVWDADELESFQSMVAPWEEQTGGAMAFSGTRDLIAVLRARVAAGNPPDVAILPNPGQMVELVKESKLVALDSFLDMNMINQQYAQGWIDLGTADGNLYGIFYGPWLARLPAHHNQRSYPYHVRRSSLQIILYNT